MLDDLKTIVIDINAKDYFEGFDLNGLDKDLNQDASLENLGQLIQFMLEKFYPSITINVNIVNDKGLKGIIVNKTLPFGHEKYVENVLSRIMDKLGNQQETWLVYGKTNNKQLFEKL